MQRQQLGAGTPVCMNPFRYPRSDTISNYWVMLMQDWQQCECPRMNHHIIRWYALSRARNAHSVERVLIAALMDIFSIFYMSKVVKLWTINLISLRVSYFCFWMLCLWFHWKMTKLRFLKLHSCKCTNRASTYDQPWLEMNISLQRTYSRISWRALSIGIKIINYHNISVSSLIANAHNESIQNRIHYTLDKEWDSWFVCWTRLWSTAISKESTTYQRRSGQVRPRITRRHRGTRTPGNAEEELLGLVHSDVHIRTRPKVQSCFCGDSEA